VRELRPADFVEDFGACHKAGLREVVAVKKGLRAHGNAILASRRDRRITEVVSWMNCSYIDLTVSKKCAE
jgi:hypothetical protein